MGKVVCAAAVDPRWRTPDAREPQPSRIQADRNRKGRGRARDVPEPDIIVNSCRSKD